MRSIKIDVRSLTYNQQAKNELVKKLQSLGYSGEPLSGFFYNFIYASGCPSSHGYCLAFGNKPKTFSLNRFDEVSVEYVMNNMLPI